MKKEFSIEDLIKLFHKNLLTIIICSLVCLGGTFSIVKFFVKPIYISTVKLYVYTKGDNQSASNSNNLNDLNYAQKIVNTYIEMLRTSDFYQNVINEGNLNYSIKDLKKMVTLSVINDTEVFQVSVSSNKPEDSKRIADLITTLAPKTISSIKESALLKVVESANFPDAASSPNLVLDSIIGLFFGVIISILYIILKEVFDIRIKNEEELSSKYEIPLLGTIPVVELNKTVRGKK